MVVLLICVENDDTKVVNNMQGGGVNRIGSEQYNYQFDHRIAGNYSHSKEQTGINR